MLRKTQDGISWLEFELLSEAKLNHGVFLSPLDFKEKDYDPIVNRILNIDRIVSGRQCHGKDVCLVAKVGENPLCDALVTKEPRLGLLLRHADCQAGIMYDPINHAVANIHSGWRGSVQNIYAETVNFMKNHFGSNPQNLLVAISPSLGPENAEFIHYRTELPESFLDFRIKTHHFNFWDISRWQLTQCGILPHHIQIAEMDTFSDKENFFSYRRDKTASRNGTIVALS